ncbi:MAG: beta-phosphoglucomutase family hydrolase [Dehalococcoidia bacterium]|nr:beta-phosphoglucomutase family hydrolase [Dehalococcoidia bacterium]
MTAVVTISRGQFDALIFDLDGVVTQTAAVHAAAWKRLFDDYLRRRAQREGRPFEPFTLEDYRLYVDGKPRFDGVVSFLESRGISLPQGAPDDGEGKETVYGLGNQKNRYFLDQLESQGAEAFPSTIDLIKDARSKGLKTAIFSASRNCVPILKSVGALDLFDARVDGVVAAELKLPGKPDPATLLEAARRLGVSPQRAVIFEDAIAGVQAGRAGGFGLVVGVNRSHEENVLASNGADVEVSDLSEVTIAP